MKKLNKYRILFFLCLLPYAAILLVLIILAFMGYGYSLGNKAYGIVAMGNWLGDQGIYWLTINIRHIILLVCTAYIIIYMLSFRNSSSDKSVVAENEADTPKNKKFGKTARLFLWLSFAPYTLIVSYAFYSAVAGIDTGLFNSNAVYGMQALLWALVIGTMFLVLIPIIPLCLIFQIAYLIINIRRKKSKAEINQNKAQSVNFVKGTNINKALIIIIFTVWGIICLWLAGLFNVSSQDPYISRDKVRSSADFTFSYPVGYTEQNLFPAGASRYIILDEMRIYWEVDKSFGYNTLSQSDCIYLGRNNDYIITLSWEGNGQVKAVYAIADPKHPDNILHVYVELQDGRLFERDSTFTGS